MFHFMSKPSPPSALGPVTRGKAVDSSATITTPGTCA